jgi:hypothetical protein
VGEVKKSIIPALREGEAEHLKFKSSLGYIAKLFQNKNKTKNQIKYNSKIKKAYKVFHSFLQSKS